MVATTGGKWQGRLGILIGFSVVIIFVFYQSFNRSFVGLMTSLDPGDQTSQPLIVKAYSNRIIYDNENESGNKPSAITDAEYPNFECPVGFPDLEGKRSIADKIAEVYREIKSAGGKRVTNAKWALQLYEAMLALDPRLQENPNTTWDYSATLPKMEVPNVTRLGKPLHVCPEVYMGSHYEYHHQHNMKMSACKNVPPFMTVLTVIIPAFTMSTAKIRQVSKEIRSMYDIPLIIAAKQNQFDNDTDVLLSQVPNVTMYISNKSKGVVLNQIISTVVRTPYVGIFENLLFFNNQSSLERLVRVMDDLQSVVVAGGASRDGEGHWTHGCLQQKEINYKAGYELGYYHSKYECMYCDDIITPFVANTSAIKSLPFDKKISGQSLYRDWFIKLRKNGLLAMTCPDVMFYINQSSYSKQNDWLPLAKSRKFNQIKTFTNKLFEYSCEQINLKCTNMMRKVKSFLMPPCCVDKFIKQLNYFLDFADKNNLDYYLQAGSNLGAVKLGHYLPWDFDMDIIVKCKDLPKWVTLNEKHNPYNCKISSRDPKLYFVFSCSVSFIEFYCRSTFSNIFLPKEIQHNGTLIKYHDRWTKVPSNPGLMARNRNGLEDLRHAPHWRHLKKNKMSVARGGYLNPGRWGNPCENPNHHSCLDKFPADGNLPFLHPPW